MLDFTYHTPTKVFFGNGKRHTVGEIIASYGFTKIMMQYGKNSLKKSGLYEEIMRSLHANGITVVEFGGVEPNPKLGFVREAIARAKEENVQMILAVGGGSVIDSSKYTALGVKTDADVWDYAMGRATPKDALPVGVVLTISAAGSEMSNSAVLTNEDLQIKKGCNSEWNRPLFAVLDPELTLTVGSFQTGCGIVDMMSHTLERYFTPLPDTLLTDSLSESLLSSVVWAGEKLTQNLQDVEARSLLMWASSLAHNGLTGCGRENYLAVHQLEHALSGLFDEIAHGAGLAVLYPAWMRYVYRENLPRFARFARKVWGIDEADDEKASVQGIEAMEDFFQRLGMPSKISSFGVPKNRLDDLANACTRGGTVVIKGYRALGTKEVKEIFESCY